jgi:hypothetical protein
MSESESEQQKTLDYHAIATSAGFIVGGTFLPELLHNSGMAVEATRYLTIVVGWKMLGQSTRGVRHTMADWAEERFDTEIDPDSDL